MMKTSYRPLVASLAALLALWITTVQAADAPPPPIPPDPSTHDQIERELQRAQEQMERAAREIADLSTQLGNQSWLDGQPWMAFERPHVMLGINIGAIQADHGATQEGVRVISVSPGGPAEVAGLKANDVIVSLAGKDLKGDTKSSPPQQLLALMHDAKPDVPMAVEFRRGDKLQKAQIVPKSLHEFVADSVSQGLRGLNDGFNERSFRMGRHETSGFGAVELAELSPGLGRYFGADKGLLVIRAPKDERLKLQDGDVILDIDGRVPSGASHAYEILSSYHAGETLKLHVMRQQKRLELAVEIPPAPAHVQDSRYESSRALRGPTQL
jgi:C-terminal processing protease CtpA/Prc